MTGPSARAWRGSTRRRRRACRLFSTFARRARSICATAKIRINPRRSIPMRQGGIAGAEQLQGKELSYNNLVDLDAAWQLIQEFDQPASAIIKHTNPCGCAEEATLADSYRRAFEADPVSAYGGVLAFNRALDEETAQEIAKTFVEAIAAPDYAPGARNVLASKKNLRLLKVDPAPADEPVVKSISGGYLVQTADTHRLERSECKVKSPSAPPAKKNGARSNSAGRSASTSNRTRSSTRAPDRASAWARAR